ncbi:hypothetical protein JCM10207_008621 [Rhodosporidiobolus poonsookiae]
MPNTGSVTPPATTPPLASTSYAPSPGPAAAEQDPFLAQTARISLTEQDRLEGYDVGLLAARPRGRYSNDEGAGGLGDDDDSLGRGEKYGGAATRVAAPHPGGQGLPPAVGAGALGSAGALGMGVEMMGMGGDAGAKEYGSGGGLTAGGMERSSGTTAMSGKRKPWFLRPLPLCLLVAFIVAVALAVGLGVGLTVHHSSSSSDSSSASNDTLSGSRSSRSSRTGSNNGTVVPSSLYSSYTSDHPITTDSDGATTTDDGDSTPMTLSPSSIPEQTATDLITAATPATSAGNLPIPAGSAAVINGTTYSALTRTSSVASSTITARARRAVRNWRA